MKIMLAVAAGGALGALARYWLAGVPTRILSGLIPGLPGGAGFPWGILVINIMGSFLMGMAVESFVRFYDPGAAWRAFLTAGLLGGFTTFSAFSLDAIALVARGQNLAAAFYIAASVGLSLAGIVLGMWLIRLVPA